MKLAQPRKPTKDNPSEWVENAEDFKTLVEYNRDDVRAEESCDKKLLPLSPTELALFHLTVEMNEKGLKIDLPLVKKANAFVKRLVIEKTGELQGLTNGEVTKVTQLARIKKHLAIHGLEVTCLDADAVEELLLRKDLHPTAYRLIQLRDLLGKSSIAKYQTMLDTVCEDGRVRGCQMYFAATTGRWGGRLMQPHNFVKADKYKKKTGIGSADVAGILTLLNWGDYEFFKTIYPDVYTALAICLRSMLIPEKDKTFFDLDWNAIEARIILWLAGDQAGLDVYLEGRDPYIEMAALVLDKDPKDITKDERQYVGKPLVLGCGFGMGWEKLAAKEDMDPVLAHAGVKMWRKLHKPVKDFWRILDKAAVEAVQHRGRIVPAGQFIKYAYDGRKLVCLLPSGRRLYYQNPKVQVIWKVIKIKTPYKDKDGKTKISIERKRIPQDVLTFISYRGSFGFRTPIHGAHHSENVTQAVARDIMGRAVLRTNKEFPFPLTIHDEGLAEVPKGSSKERFIELMERPVEWAPGLPLKTEFWQNDRFGSY